MEEGMTDKRGRGHGVFEFTVCGRAGSNGVLTEREIIHNVEVWSWILE